MNKLNSFSKSEKSVRPFALAIIAWMLFSLNTQAQLVNIPVTGFNNDVVANGTGPANTVSSGTIPGITYPTIGVDGSIPATSFIDSTYKWYSGSVAPACFLPTGGAIPSALTSGLTYQLQSYSAHNALTIVSNAYPGSPHQTLDTISLVTPARYPNLYVLYESIVRSGASANITATVIFTDASTQAFTSISAVNWGDNVGRAYSPSVSRAPNSAPGAPAVCGILPCLYQMTLALDPANYTKEVQSISFKWTSSYGTTFNTLNYLHIMAVGGLSPCAVPTNQPTGLTLSSSSINSINGSFTAAVGSPTGYLTVMYPAGNTPVNPVSGTTYTVGATIGTGKVVSVGATTSFTATSLDPGTTYDFYVYSYNNLPCVGGPTYNTTINPTQNSGSKAVNSCANTPSPITVGPGGTYATLSGAGGALAALAATGISAPTVIELKSTYTAAGEVYPITISYNGCFNAINTLTIRPDAATASPHIISSADTNATFDLNGAQYVIIDGRPGGLTTNKYLEIRNTSSVPLSAGKAILLRNDASYNILRYLDVKASNRNLANNGAVLPVNLGAIPGAIALGSTNKFYGNDNNQITFCNIHSVTATDSLNVCIYAGSSKLSSDPAANDSLTISNCNIYDFYNPATASSGINVSLGNNRFKIENNSFYQTVPRNYTAVLAFVRAIWITPATGTALQFGGGYTISGNIIGGSAPGGQGMCTMTSTNNASYLFSGIQLSVGSLDTSSVQNNTITKMDIAGGFSAQGVFGISIDNGNVNVGTETGNMVGSTAVKGAIKITGTGTTGTPAMVGYRSAQGSGTGTSTNFSNNTVAGIDIFTTVSTLGAGFTGINVTGGVNNIIHNNTIGSPTMANSIDMASTNTTSITTQVRGINCAASVATNAITNNLIANINSNYSASGAPGNLMFGISIGANLNTTVSGNTIRNITNKANTTGSGATSAIIGIANTNNTGTSIVTITGNKIHTLKLTNPVAPPASYVQITGIAMGANTAANVVDGNDLHSFSVATNTNNVAITGITCISGVATYSNNMIRLGLDSAGNSVTGGILLRGITKGSTNGNNFYHNSVYIGGTNVVASIRNSFAFQRGTAATGAPNDIVVNNIFVNNRSNAIAGGKHYSDSLNSSAFLTQNSNVYYGIGNGYFVGALAGADYLTLINNWVPGDANSYFFDPKFVSTGNLHIDPTTPSIVEGTGIPVPSILNDFDNQVRLGLSPIDIGADAGNFTNLVCNSAPVIGSSSVTGASPICVGGTTTLTVSGLVNTPGVTLQWQEASTPAGPYSNVIGGTGSVNFTTPPVLANTYYVCKATCTNGGGSSQSTESLVSVISPIVTQTVPASRCGAGSVILNATAQPGATLNWYDAPTGGIPVPGNTFTTPIFGVTTDFYVAAVVTSPFSCVGLRTPVTASVAQPSIPISSVSTASLVCLGNSTQLSVSSVNDPNYSYTWSSTPTGFIATGPGPHFAAPTASVTTYQVYAYDASTDCGALSSQVVNATPNNLLVTATSTPSSVCYGQDAQLNSIPGRTSKANEYTFSASSGSFTPITGGTATSLATNETENISTAFNIGFSFFYGTTNYTTVQATSNGVLLFGSGRANTFTNDLATTTLTQRPGVAPLWDDLQCEFGVKYLVTGTPGSRVLTVEWLNMEWTANANNPVISFQVKLYENSNVIQFVYRQESLGILNGSASIGIMGAAANDFISLQNSSSSPTISTTTSTNSISVKPATGQVYTFTPPAQVGLLSYVWTGTNLSSNSITNPVASNLIATETFSVTMTDQDNGCAKTASVNVVVNPLPVPQLSGNAAVCENDLLILSAFDGNSYSWTGPNSYSATTAGDPINGSSVFLFNMQEVNEGNYTVLVTNSFGCTTSQTQYFYVNDRPELSLASVTPVSCFGGNNGSFVVGVTGGTAPYVLSESYTNQSNGDGIFDGLTAYNNYEVTITDDAIPSCSSVNSLMVSIPTVPNIAPEIICPSDIVMGNTPGQCGAIVNYTAPVGTDNCPNGLGTSMISGIASGNLFPIGTTTVVFRVTDELGMSTTCSFNVTVNDTQAPYLASGSSCPSSLTACNPVSWTAPSYIDNCPGVQITSSHTPGTNFPVGTTTVTYTATDLKSNSTTCTFNVTVLDTSSAATSITSNRDFNNICLGGDITLTINGGHLGEVSAGVPAQWKWYTGSCGGSPVGSGASLTVAPTSTTTYYVRPEGGCNAPGCVSITVTVSTNAPTGSVVYNTVPAYGAPGVTTTLSVNPVPGATFYRWFTNNGHINSVLFDGQLSPHETTVPTTQISFVLPEQNYQIRVLAGNGCGRTGQANTHIRGTVEAPTSMSGPASVCTGSAVTYTIPAVASNGPASYQWNLVPASAGTISMAANGLSATVNFNAGFGTAQVCANGVSTFGLAGPAYCLTVINSAPVPGAVSGQASPCFNNAYSYSIATGTPGTTYTWSTTAGSVQSTAGNGLSAVILFQNSPFTNQTVCVTASSACGTSLPSCFTVNSGTPADPGAINGPSSGVCAAPGINYSLATSNANSYQWAVTSGMSLASPSTSNSVNVNFLPGFTSGTVSVTAYYDCGSVVKTLNVSGAPALPVILPAAVCPGTALTYFVSNAVTGVQYSWTVTGDILDSACTETDCSQFYIQAGSGGGNYQVTATNACGTAGPVNSGTCRIAAQPMTMEIYPNPTTGMLTVDFSSQNGGQYQITVTDLSGRVIMAEDLNAVSGRNQHQVDLGFTNAGLYMIYLKNVNGEIAVHKIAVE